MIITQAISQATNQLGYRNKKREAKLASLFLTFYYSYN